LRVQRVTEFWGIFAAAKTALLSLLGLAPTVPIKEPGMFRYGPLGFLWSSPEESKEAQPSMEAAAALRNRLAPEQEERLAAEQIRLMYQNVPLVMGGTFSALAALVWLFWAAVPKPMLLGWAAIATFWAGQGVRLWIRYERANPRPAEARRWGREFTKGAIVAGFILGVSGFVLAVPGSAEYRALLLFMVSLFVTGSAASYASYLPAFFAFLVPLVLTIGASLLYVGGATHYVLGMVLLVFSGIVATFARNFNQVLTQALALSLRNMDLVEQLTQKNEPSENPLPRRRQPRPAPADARDGAVRRSAA
jgi:predicted signal transduction protein with EAL and GGDEF domain